MFGEVNPSGRLPLTYPATVNGFTPYDLLPLEDFEFNKYEYLFPFGHGLSYTTFEYSNLVLSTRQLVAPNPLTVSVTVRNSGTRAGKESVLLFLNDRYGSVPRPVRQLKKFKKVTLNPGASETVSFTLNMDDLSFINAQYQRIYEPGEFRIYVANLNSTFVLSVDPAATTTRMTSMTTTTGGASSTRLNHLLSYASTMLVVLAVFKLF